MFVMRAYYDAYTRARQFHEQALEREANALLARAPGRTPEGVMDAARALLATADTDRARPDLRDRIIELFDDLFHSIGLQSDMTKYGGSGPERGCSLEFLDYPLNNRWWLEDEFERVAALPDEAAKWARLEELRTWDPPALQFTTISAISLASGMLPRIRPTSHERRLRLVGQRLFPRGFPGRSMDRAAACATRARPRADYVLRSRASAN